MDGNDSHEVDAPCAIISISLLNTEKHVIPSRKIIVLRLGAPSFDAPCAWRNVLTQVTMSTITSAAMDVRRASRESSAALRHCHLPCLVRSHLNDNAVISYSTAYERDLTYLTTTEEEKDAPPTQLGPMTGSSINI